MPVSPPVCIDLYHGDNVLSFHDVLSAGGISFVWHKCTEGETPDPAYLHRRKLAHLAGIPHFGAYHFLHGHDPQVEAEAFLEFAEVTPDLALCVDWEPLRDGSYATAQQAAAFIEHVLEQTGRTRMWVYGGNVLKEGINGNDPAAKAYWSNHLLWLAQYNTQFVTPLAWGRPPDLWQNNGDLFGPGPHHVPGIGNACDNSCIANGTYEDLVGKWASPIQK